MYSLSTMLLNGILQISQHAIFNFCTFSNPNKILSSRMTTTSCMKMFKVQLDFSIQAMFIFKPYNLINTDFILSQQIKVFNR